MDIKQRTAKFRERFNDLLATHDVTVNRVSTLGNMSQSSLSDIANGKASDPRLSSLLKIADGLDMSLTELLDFPPYNQRPDGTSAAKRRDKWEQLGDVLTPEERDRVRRVLLGENQED
jgi:transcriptional regulator with XRE-family HTH domain